MAVGGNFGVFIPGAIINETFAPAGLDTVSLDGVQIDDGNND